MGKFDHEKEDLLKEFYIPDYILDEESAIEPLPFTPSCPVVAFVNSRSGGQRGGDLLETYRKVLNRAQVFDLGAETPDKVLHKLYSNLKRLKSNGDHLADEIEKSLKLIVAGGDGTVSWLLGVVSDLKLAHAPPIVTVPLGTGNNIHYSFGWGKKNPSTDLQSVKSFLQQVRNAKEIKMDSWHIIMRMKAFNKDSCDPNTPPELPHSLHAFRRVSDTDSLNMEGYHTFRGGFWNYFSMGMDAQVSYAFHSERKLHPEKFKNQLANQRTYLKLGCKQGWFCASLCHPASRNIAQLANMKIMRKSGQWEKLHVPQSIRSIVCLNLPSFSGGLNPWGTPDRNKQQDRDLSAPFVDDGLIEIVGFRDAWHGLLLLSSKGHGTRLAQAHRVRFKFLKGAADHSYMRLDGEPWKQPLPMDGHKVVIDISHLGQVKMLAKENCIAKSIHDVSRPLVEISDSESSEDLDNNDLEERRKFGAAETFKYSDDTDDATVS